MMGDRLLHAALIACALWSAPAAAKDCVGYLPADPARLSRILPPPPAEGSPAVQREIDEMLAVQRGRTAEQIALAQADRDTGPDRLLLPLGLSVADPALPRTAALLARITCDTTAAIDASKNSWRKRRPFLVSPQIDPVVKKPATWSYPSGHALRSYTVALVLSRMVPERGPALLQRGSDYGDNRVLGGVHWPSDVTAGRMAAVAIGDAMFADAGFRHDFAQARAELRRRLALPLRGSPQAD